MDFEKSIDFGLKTLNVQTEGVSVHIPTLYDLYKPSPEFIGSQSKSYGF